MQWAEYVASGANGVTEGAKQPKLITRADVADGMIEDVEGWEHRVFIVVDGNHRVTLLMVGGRLARLNIMGFRNNGSHTHTHTHTHTPQINCQ